MQLNLNTLRYPFGSPMPNRSFSASSYRYGFNGQEKDDEVSGSGNSNTAEYWQYDTRLGRRWNIDPEYKSFANESPYVVFHNNPIYLSDPLGNKPGNPDKAVKKFEKKVDKEKAKDANLSTEDAIKNVENTLTDEQKYVTTSNESSNSEMNYVTYKVSDLYRQHMDEKTPISPTIQVPNTLTEIPILNRSTATTFDESYNVTAVPGAISTNVTISNIGRTNGSVTISYDSNNGTNLQSQTLTVPAGGNQSVALLTTTNFIQIEYNKASVNNSGVSAQIELNPPVSTVLGKPKFIASGYPTIAKPKMKDIKAKLK